MVQIVRADTDALRRSCLSIRFEVFVDEQGVPPDLEIDVDDDRAVHVLALDGGEPVGAARLLFEVPGYAELDPSLGPVGHLGRIAVRSAARGNGIGAALVVDLGERAALVGCEVLALSSQVEAIGFYERLGYQAYSGVFDDAGIPHRWMSRRASAGPGLADQARI